MPLRQPDPLYKFKQRLVIGSSGPVPTLDLNFGNGTFIPNVGPLPTFSRASAATYVGSDGLIATATTNTPRLDYDPVTLVCRGLLMEPAATNLIEDSTNFSGWTQDACSVADGPIASPSGGTSKRLTMGAATSGYGFYKNPVAPSGFVTLSWYVRYVNTQWIFIRTGAPEVWASFDILNGVNGTAHPSITGCSIVAAGGGWWRVSLTWNCTGGQVYHCIRSGDSGTPGVTVTTVGTEAFDIWRPQLEAGQTATSVIQTSGSTATRAADVCSISGSDFSGIWNAAGSTIVAEFETSLADEFAAIVGVHTSGYFESCCLFKIDSSYTTIGDRLQVQRYADGFAPVTQDLGGGHNTGALEKCAIAITPTDTRISLNGNSVSSADGPAIAPSELFIGQRDGSYGAVMRMRRLRVFGSVLTDDHLQSLTAP